MAGSLEGIAGNVGHRIRNGEVRIRFCRRIQQQLGLTFVIQHAVLGAVVGVSIGHRQAGQADAAIEHAVAQAGEGGRQLHFLQTAASPERVAADAR